MQEEQVRALLLFIAAGTKILASRIVLVATLFLAFSLFAWAMYLPGELRIYIATIFAVLVFLPVIFSDRKIAATKNNLEGNEP